MSRLRLVAAAATLVLAGCGGHGSSRPAPTPTPVATASPAARGHAGGTRARRSVAVYARTRAGMEAPAVRQDPARVYVPNSQSDTVDVISQRTMRRVASFPVGDEPQHVVPAWDLKTLWVASDRGSSLTPLDPRTGPPGVK